MRHHLASGDCPRCGWVQAMTTHLQIVHGFTRKRAAVVTVRLVSKERLAPRDAQQLGVPVTRVKASGYTSRRASLEMDDPALRLLPSPEAVRAAVEGMR